MRKEPVGAFITINPESKEPYYLQVYLRHRDAILQGTLKLGDRVPAVRALAKELGLARGTIEMAYSMLISEGYLESRGQAGTVVCANIAASADKRAVTAATAATDKKTSSANCSMESGLQAQAPEQEEASAARLIQRTHLSRAVQLLPFQMGVPALDQFPRKLWARLGARCLRETQLADLAYPDPEGDLELRTAIAAYLQVSRGIECVAEQVFVTTGYRNTLELVARVVMNDGDQVWMEDPGFPPVRSFIRERGGIPESIPVDENGIDVEGGIRQAPNAGLAIVTPANQSPTGVSLSLARRTALLEWANASNAWILEDDYDGEYRYVSRPLPALKSMDTHGRVLYAGTFSKVLFPGLRLAYLVVPTEQIDKFERASVVFQSGSPNLMQQLVAQFMREGHFARHIQKMRQLYAHRKEVCTEGLTEALGDRFEYIAANGGMHLRFRVHETPPARTISTLMRSSGMFASPMANWSERSIADDTLLLGFTNITDKKMATALGAKIRELLEQPG